MSEHSNASVPALSDPSMSSATRDITPAENNQSEAAPKRTIKLNAAEMAQAVSGPKPDSLASLAEKLNHINNNDRTEWDDETRILFRKAIDSPTSLTDAERRIIADRPPQEAEDALCRQHLGITMTELFAKAVQDGASLTHEEAKSIAWGFDSEKFMDNNSCRLRLTTEEDRNLYFSAVDAALTEEMRAAKEAAQAVETRVGEEKLASSKLFSDLDRRNFNYANFVPWQRFLLAAVEKEHMEEFGLIAFFRNEDVRWPKLKKKVDEAIYHGLRHRYFPTTEAVSQRFTINWIEYGSEQQPQQVFEEMTRTGRIPAGFRTDGFLYVDEDSLQSHDAVRPYLWYWEPQSDEEPLKVDAKHVCPTLFARLTQRDLPTDKEKLWPYGTSSDLTDLHKIAAREEDGIWPSDPLRDKFLGGSVERMHRERKERQERRAAESSS